MRWSAEATNALKLGGVVVKERLLRLSREMPSNAEQAPEQACKQVTSGLGKVSKCLESDEGTTSLLHELILRREDVMCYRIRNETMLAILSALRAKGFQFTSQYIASKKRNLIKYYRDKKKVGDDSWRFYDLVAQLVGDIDFDGSFAELKTSNDRKCIYLVSLFSHIFNVYHLELFMGGGQINSLIGCRRTGGLFESSCHNLFWICWLVQNVCFTPRAVGLKRGTGQGLWFVPVRPRVDAPSHPYFGQGR